MKKLNKTVLALLPTAVLVLSCTACSSDGGSSSAAGGTESAGSTESGETGETAASDLMLTPAGELPVVEEGVEVNLTFGVMQSTSLADYKTNYFTQKIEAETGVNLEFIEYPSDTIEEKILLILSTNDESNLPDVFLGTTTTTNDTIFGPSYAARWYEEGMIITLNDLIDEYGVNFQEMLAKSDDYGHNILDWITSPDGNIYALPRFSDSLTNSYPNKLWINQGWLDNLGLDIPTTTDEFRAVLEAFRNDNPNGNDLQDEIPFSGANQAYSYGYDFIINAFIYNQSDYSRMYVEDGEVKFAATTDEWRDAMIYLRGLVDDGLYYEGSFTQDLTSQQQIVLNDTDILGAFEGLDHDLMLVTDDEEILGRWDSVPALEGPDGAHYTTYTPPGVRPSGVITTKCEYPEIAFRVLDQMMSDENAKVTRYGEKGVNWDDADDGSISYYSEDAVIKILENTWGQAGQNQNFMQQSPYILDPAIGTGVQWDGDDREAGYIKALSVTKLQDTGEVPEETIANIVYTEEEIEKINSPRTDIDSYITQSIANFVAGSWDPTDDTQWDNYVAEYEKMGLSTYIEVLQTAFDRMKAGS